jgi:hypothetical protein
MGHNAAAASAEIRAIVRGERAPQALAKLRDHREEPAAEQECAGSVFPAHRGAMGAGTGDHGDGIQAGSDH